MSHSHSSVIHVENSNTLYKLFNEKQYVVIDFTATWCVPCQHIAPIYDKLSQEHTRWTFTKVDVDLVPDAAEQFEVSGMPTFVFVKDGIIIGRIIGYDVNGLVNNLVSLC